VLLCKLVVGKLIYFKFEKFDVLLTFLSNKKEMKVTLLGGCVDDRGYKDGQSNNSRFDYPSGITVDNKGNLFIADYCNHIIRKINTSGEVSTFAGKPKVSGYQDGKDALFNYPRSCILDKDGTLLVLDDGNKCIRRINCGIVSTIELFKWEYQGNKKNKVKVELKEPWGMKLTPNGDILLVDRYAIFLICDGIITNVFGNIDKNGYLDGPIQNALFNPMNVTMDKKGDIWVADCFNDAIRKISDGIVTTVAKIEYPNSITMNENGNIFVICNKKIVELHSNGELVNLIELTDGNGITIDFTGIYFIDKHAIKKIHFIVYWKKGKNIVFVILFYYYYLIIFFRYSF